jgi:hypothetical protein
MSSASMVSAAAMITAVNDAQGMPADTDSNGFETGQTSLGQIQLNKGEPFARTTQRHHHHHYHRQPPSRRPPPASRAGVDNRVHPAEFLCRRSAGVRPSLH